MATVIVGPPRTTDGAAGCTLFADDRPSAPPSRSSPRRRQTLATATSARARASNQPPASHEAVAADASGATFAQRIAILLGIRMTPLVTTGRVTTASAACKGRALFFPRVQYRECELDEGGGGAEVVDDDVSSGVP